jgi:hypothetical protein
MGTDGTAVLPVQFKDDPFITEINLGFNKVSGYSEAPIARNSLPTASP